MEIPVELALKIVKDMKDIINQDLNFINIKGIIIASTDPERCGSKHEAALKCVATNSVIVINNDDEYVGSKKGINIPVHLDNEIVGVIGITGDRSEVERYGKIIKSMTEILIKEAWLKEMSMKKREYNRNIIETLLFSKHRNIDFYSSIQQPYFVIVGNTDNKFENNEELYKILEAQLSFNKKNIFTITSNEIIILMNENQKKYVRDIIQGIQVRLEDIFKFNFKFGIGRLIENDINDFKGSYLEGRNALQYIVNFETNKDIVLYSELDLGIIFPSLNTYKIAEFVEKIFKNLSDKEIESFYEIFLSYKNNNGSIKEASEELYMHKNTLQYQLNKIEKLTGYNPRNLKDFTILDIAFALKKFNHN